MGERGNSRAAEPDNSRRGERGNSRAAEPDNSRAAGPDRPTADNRRPAFNAWIIRNATINSEGGIMKGEAKIIEQLNLRLSEELAAISQYMVHSEMCDNWGYSKLHSLIEKRAIDEMKHAEKLIGRILFLEGIPVVSNLAKIFIGADVPKQIQNDHDGEAGAIKNYNDTIRLASELGDNGTKELLDSILQDEEGHIDTLEAQQDQIQQLGLQNFLEAQL
jgi:bacterioferritin